nr:MAG TPA: type VI secretion protein [Caudoviricetes sp.]
MKKLLKVLGIIFLVLIVMGIIGAFLPDDESAKTSESPTTEVASKSKWTYSEKTDEMDNSKIQYAQLTSTNKLEFEFPYDGGSTFTFWIRKTNGKYELLLTVDKGQFISNLLDNEKLRIKFDDGEAFKWNYADANDGRADVIFPTYSDEFLGMLKKSKTMLIEAPFAFAGRQVIRFNTENLNSDF